MLIAAPSASRSARMVTVLTAAIEVRLALTRRDGSGRWGRMGWWKAPHAVRRERPSVRWADRMSEPVRAADADPVHGLSSPAGRPWRTQAWYQLVAISLCATFKGSRSAHTCSWR